MIYLNFDIWYQNFESRIIRILKIMIYINWQLYLFGRNQNLLEF